MYHNRNYLYLKILHCFAIERIYIDGVIFVFHVEYTIVR